MIKKKWTQDHILLSTVGENVDQMVGLQFAMFFDDYKLCFRLLDTSLNNAVIKQSVRTPNVEREVCCA